MTLQRGGRAAALGVGMLATLLACGRDEGEPPDTAEVRPGAPATASPAGAAGDPDIEEVRKARAALLEAGIPVYPGASGLDATEFDANTAPFIAIDFFTADAPASVVAFYDREIEDLTVRRDTTIESGAVRYELERSFSGVVVRPWDSAGADSSGFFARIDRRDAQGVSSSELDVYGRMLQQARSHIVVNLPRPEPDSL